MAVQIQAGQMVAQTEQPNAVGGVLAGISSGADWAMKNYDLQTKKEALAAERQKNLASMMKIRADVGERTAAQIKKIAMLPNGPTKKSMIDLLDEELSSFGTPLSPTARALMEDKNMQQDWMDIINYIDSADPEKRIQAMSSIPYVLQQGKESLDIFNSMKVEAGKNKRNLISAMATASNQEANRQLQIGLQQMKQEQESQMGEKKFSQDLEKQGREFKQEKELLRMKLAADKLAKKEDVLKDIRADVVKAGETFTPIMTSLDRLRNVVKKSGGVWNAMLIGDLDTLRSGKQNVVREGDVATFEASGGVIDKASTWLSTRMTTGEKIGPEAKAQINELVKVYDKIYENAYLDRLSTNVDRVKNIGASPTEVFLGDQLRVLGKNNIFKGAKSTTQKAVEEKEAAASAPIDLGKVKQVLSTPKKDGSFFTISELEKVLNTTFTPEQKKSLRMGEGK